MRCFSSPGLLLPCGRWRTLRSVGLPHSEILGSRPVCGSPRLIAAYHVLRRLPVPRHPPCALTRLISLLSVSRCDSSTPHTHTRQLSKSTLRVARSTFHEFSCDVRRATCDCPMVERGECGRRFRGLSPRALRHGLTRRSRKEVIQPQVPLRLPCY